MEREGGDGLLLLAIPQVADQFQVLPVRLDMPLPQIPPGEQADPLVLVIDVGQHFFKIAVGAGSGDLAVEIIVQAAEIRRRWFSVQKALRLLLYFLKHLVVQGVHIIGDDKWLQEQPGLKGLVDFCEGESGDHHPFFGNDLYQPFLLQFVEGFPYGSAAGIDFLYEIRLIQRRIRPYSQVIIRSFMS